MDRRGFFGTALRGLGLLAAAPALAEGVGATPASGDERPPARWRPTEKNILGA